MNFLSSNQFFISSLCVFLRNVMGMHLLCAKCNSYPNCASQRSVFLILPQRVSRSAAISHTSAGTGTRTIKKKKNNNIKDSAQRCAVFSVLHASPPPPPPTSMRDAFWCSNGTRADNIIFNKCAWHVGVSAPTRTRTHTHLAHTIICARVRAHTCRTNVCACTCVRQFMALLHHIKTMFYWDNRVI